MEHTRHIRIVAGIAALAVALSLIPAPPASAEMSLQAIPSFTFRGSGYGHGIGMSQWGAYGAAKAGKDYRWILGHYYSGTTVGTASTPEVKVNIDCAYRDSSYPGRPSWTIRAVGSPLNVWRTNSFDPTITLAADTFYTFTTDGTTVTIRDAAGAIKGQLAWDVWVAPADSDKGLLEVKDKSTSTDGAYHPLTAEGLPTDGYYNVRYRGKIWLDRKGTRLAAVNQLPMQYYLYGVVPREMPASWVIDHDNDSSTPPKIDALKVQAVAARSYGFADVAGGSVLKCTTYSQVYKGHSRLSQGKTEPHEDSRSNQAVDETNGEVVKTSSGRVAKAYFFSQSGGHTANNEDVWVSGTPLSYTRGVPDPYEQLVSPPYSPWPASKERTYTGLQLSEKLQGISGVPGVSAFVTAMSIERVQSGHARYVTFTFANGATVRVSGDTVRSRLGLLSTRFYITGFPMERIYGNTRYDTAVKVSATAFPSTAPAVVLASGEDYADALTGSALAGAADGALLLSASKALPEVTRRELVRLAPMTVYIMGGTAALSADVERAVRTAIPGATIRRLQGANRYQTARMAADIVAGLGGAEKVIVASGTGWADAAAASALAYAKAYPILLTRADVLDAEAAGFLAAEKPGTTLLVGGTSVLSPSIQSAVAGATSGSVYRDGGHDRYETAAKVAQRCLDQEAFTADEVYVATGEAYADALTGGTLAGLRGRTLLLTRANVCPVNTAAYLKAHRTSITLLWLLGGDSAITPTGQTALDTAMAQ